ncbi:4959_t:CDS:1, partial [Racocetra fulgida]
MGNSINSGQVNNDELPTSQHPEMNQTHTAQATDANRAMESQEGNYTSSSTINNLIAQLNSGNPQTEELDLSNIKL